MEGEEWSEGDRLFTDIVLGVVRDADEEMKLGRGKES